MMSRFFSRKAVRAVSAAVSQPATYSPAQGRSQPPVHEPLEPRRMLSVNVTTYHYDNARDGANTHETTLTPTNVNVNTFGKIASFSVSGEIYAQPLIVTNVAVSGQGTHDIVLVATEADLVYAFDAYGNNPAQGYLWKTSLLQSGETTVPDGDVGTSDITSQIGITGSPVVDASTGTLYVVGAFKESNATYTQRLYALDITSGATKFGGPVTITASVPGQGYDSVNGMVSFNELRENQRPALTLANGEVYVGWSSHGDVDPWHGWVIAYNAATLNEDEAYCDTANGEEGGIWMSGGGIAVDSSGNLYFTTGNGTFDGTTDGDYSMSIEKLSPSLSVEDFFAPYNEASLSSDDLDYGCSSVVLLPTQSDSAAPNEILTESKWGRMYLNNGDTGDLGEFNSNGSGPNDDLSETTIGTDMHNTIAYWNGMAYVGGDRAQLKDYSVSDGALSQTSLSQTANVFGTTTNEDGQGCSPTISSNGNNNGIVWALDNTGFTTNPAVLYAYNANNLGQLLWSSSQAPGGRDTAGNAIKFQAAVVANGDVYVAGYGTLTVYGLLPISSLPPTIINAAASSPSPVTGTTAVVSVLATDTSPDSAPTYTWVASSIPTGATTPTFSVNSSATANHSTVTFHQAGAYTITVTMTDPSNTLTAVSSVNVVVSQTVTALSVSPSGTTTLEDGAEQQFTAAGTDQFGSTISPSPAYSWAITGSGVGTISSSGLYQAPATGTGTAQLQAAAGGLTAGAVVHVTLPPWLPTTSAASWNASTQVLTVTGALSLTADPGSDQPIIVANGSSAVVAINPGSAMEIDLGGLNLTHGASAVVTSLGSARTASNHRLLVIGQAGATTSPLLDIDSSSKLNLTDNDLLIHGSSLAAVTSLLPSGLYANASSGIISSNLASGSLFVLADSQPAAAGTFDNQAVGASDVEVRYTYLGDFTLSGQVNAADYAIMDANFQNHLAGFYNGDFSGDGIINGSDYSMMDNSFNAQGPALDAQIATAASRVASNNRGMVSAAGNGLQNEAIVTPAAIVSPDQWFAITGAPIVSTHRAKAMSPSSEFRPRLFGFRTTKRAKLQSFSNVKIRVLDPAYNSAT